ncbi:helix-turn-helix transcriptional regulator [bacterium]|nr:helix-turn-helix transcriptional regulator [bacterium]
MQCKNEKTLHYLKVLGQVIKQKRLKTTDKSRHNFCNSYELDSSNLRRIENGEIEPKVTMLLRISEALNTPLSEIINETEKKLGKNFFVIEQ